MNHTAFILFTFLFSFQVFGQQNLILNGNFEEYWECPQALTEIEKCKYVYNPCYHAQPPSGPPVWSSTSDYFNSCASMSSGCSVPINSFGFQEARSGNGYLGLSNCDLWSDYREYIQLSFATVLEPYATYKFSVYINLTNNGGYTSKNLEFKFTDNLLYYSDYLSEFLIPDVKIDTLSLTDTMEWKEVSFEYIARGGEKYLILGNFKTSTSGDCIFNHLSSEPLSTDYCYFFFDDASLTKIKDADPIVFPNIITPNNDGINDEFRLLSGQEHFEEMVIYNRWGSIVYSSNSYLGWFGQDQSGNLLSDGVYFVQITGKILKEKNKREQYNGAIHLIR